MRTLTNEEALDWCKAWPVQLELDNEGVFQIPSTWHSYRVDLSKLPWREILPIASSVAFLGCHTVEEFSGAMVWIRRTGIAVPEMEGVVRQTLERFRLGYGETRSLETAKAHIFRNDESSELAGVLLLILLAEWDAYVVHPTGDWVAAVNHDDYITVGIRTREAAERTRVSLEAWGPTTEVSWP